MRIWQLMTVNGGWFSVCKKGEKQEGKSKLAKACFSGFL